MRFAALIGQRAIVYAVATAMAIHGRETEHDGTVTIRYARLVEMIGDGERTAVRRAVDTIEQLGILDVTGRARGAVTYTMRPARAPADRAPAEPAPAPRKRAPAAQQATFPATSVPNELNPERRMKAEKGQPYGVETVLHALHEASKGSRGGSKLNLASYWNKRDSWYKKLIPIVQSMISEGYTLDHVRSAGAIMRDRFRDRRTVTYIYQDGGDKWLRLLEQARTRQPVQAKTKTAQRRIAREGI